jgi:hypothetical protein
MPVLLFFGYESDMRDYSVVLPNGRRETIAQVPSWAIEKWLTDPGFLESAHLGADITLEGLRERLRLELEIRELGLRG